MSKRGRERERRERERGGRGGEGVSRENKILILGASDMGENRRGQKRTASGQGGELTRWKNCGGGEDQIMGTEVGSGMDYIEHRRG